MKSKPYAVAASLLMAGVYAAGVIIVRYLVAAVRTATEHFRESGEITAEVINQGIGSPALTDLLGAYAVVDAAVILLLWRSVRGRGASAAAPAAALGTATLLWGLLFAGGLQMVFLSVVPWLQNGTQALPLHELQNVPAAMWVLVAVLHPLAVEMLFRHTIMGRLREGGVRTQVAVLIQAVLFCAVQPSLLLAAFALVFGLVAGTLAQRTAFFPDAIVLHFMLVLAGALLWLNTEPTGTLEGRILLGIVGATASTAGCWFILRSARPGLYRVSTEGAHHGRR